MSFRGPNFSWRNISLISFVAIFCLTDFNAAYSAQSAESRVPFVVAGATLGEFRHGTYPSIGDRTHVGVDLLAPCDTPVQSYADGVVIDLIDTEEDRDFKSLGYMVLVHHKNIDDRRPVATLYLHLNEKPLVKKNQNITLGHIIGKVGNTGFVIGESCHLHFEVRHFMTRYNMSDGWRAIYGQGDQRNTTVFKRDWSDPQHLLEGLFKTSNEDTGESLDFFESLERDFGKVVDLLSGQSSEQNGIASTQTGPLDKQADSNRELLAERGGQNQTKARVRETQQLLAMLGFDPGPADGLYGPRTQNAITSYQRSRGLAADGQTSSGLVDQLKSEVALANDGKVVARGDRAIRITAGSQTSSRWIGKANQGDDRSIEITRNGTYDFRIDYPSLNCGGKLKVLLVSSLEWKLSERITYGQCGNRGRIRVRFINNNSAEWERRNQFGMISASGALARKAMSTQQTAANSGTSAQNGSVSFLRATGGGNIADQFHSDKVQAMRYYSSWREIVFNVRSLGVSNGNAVLSDIQVPRAVNDFVQKTQRNFSWDSFHKMAAQGNNPYAQRFEVICKMDLEEFAKSNNIREGVTLSINAKLESYAGKTVVFLCKF